jgi:hypothetical protein
MEINMKPTLKTYKDGTQTWWLNGEYHREDGPAIIRPDGTKRWYLNGKIHREDGPAAIYPDGTQEWFLNGEFHREDGPAYIGSDGSQYWFLNDKEITEEINDWAKERNIDLNNMSDMDKMVLKIEIKMWK